MEDEFKEKNSKSKEVNKNGIKQSIYCVSCFNKIIWENNNYKLGSNNEEVISVKTISQNGLKYDENFKISIHQIDLKKHAKKLKLFLSNKDKKWNLNEITMSSKDNDKDSDIILFVDIDINNNFLPDLLNDVKSNYANEKKIDKISRKLETNEILDIYLNYFKQNGEIPEKVKLNLVKQFIRKVKDDDNKSFFSNFIKVFKLSFGTKAILDFLKCYQNIDFKMDEFKDEEFENYVKNGFFSKNNEYIQAGNDKNLLENFIIIYKLFYKLDDIKEDSQKIKNVRQTLIKLINNKKDLIECISFILNYFEAFHIVLTTEYNEKLKIEANLSKNMLKIFITLYSELVNLQKESDFILDFTSIFNNLVKERNEYEDLIKIKSIYKSELQVIGNQSFEKNIKEKIHKSGLEIIEKRENNNLFLIDFLNEDKEYLKNKKEKEKFNILKYFKVDLMDDNFFNIFNKNKIYSIF